MDRKRVIDTEAFYFDDELVELLGERGLHFYIRLWGIAEDWGGFEPKYGSLALKMGALKFSIEEVKKYLNRLLLAGKIFEYEIQGKKYHWLTKLMKHQPLNNPSPPQLPLPDWIICEEHRYPSGKRYANYSCLIEKLPRHYQKPTSSLPVITPTIETIETIETETNRNGIETETAREEKSPPSASYSLDFEFFFLSYPRKCEKATAFKNWQTCLRNKIKPSDLIQAAGNYAAKVKAEGTEGQYIKKAGNFIREKIFIDYLTGTQEEWAEKSRVKTKQELYRESLFPDLKEEVTA